MESKHKDRLQRGEKPSWKTPTQGYSCLEKFFVGRENSNIVKDIDETDEVVNFKDTEELEDVGKRENMGNNENVTVGENNILP